MRIDKYLWSVRVFKTRSIATAECRSNKVLLDDQPVKPAREIKENDLIKVRKGAVWYHYRVKGIPKSRIGAKLVEEFLDNQTPKDELVKLEIIRQNVIQTRWEGGGRPTKKDRRDLGKFID